MNKRFTNCMAIIAVLISLSHFVNAAKPVCNLPSQFSDEEFGPIYMNGAYGCSNMRPIYYLTIDFEAKTYTRIEKGCSAGDGSYFASRGNIEWVDGKAIKTLKERGYGNNNDSIAARNRQGSSSALFTSQAVCSALLLYNVHSAN